MSTIDAAEGPSVGERRVESADLPRAYASRPGADPLKALRYWATDAATPRRGVPRPDIVPAEPVRPEPAEILRQLAALAVEDSTREVTLVPERSGLPQRGASPTPAESSTPAPRSGRRAAREASREAEMSDDDRSTAAIRSARVESLAALGPVLGALAEHVRPEMRTLYAVCMSMLACDGQARTDREVWRTLLGLAKYDDDAGVRTAADAALADLERFGTVAAG